MSKQYVPVLVGVYDRYDHFVQCIESLRRNALALNTDLYVASDCSADKHNQDVEKVRDYCRTIDGFKSVVLLFREENMGAQANYKQAIKTIFESHDRVIVMEDDVITSRHFLDFINDGLDLYADNLDVVGVSGYLFPEGVGTTETTFFLKRRVPYGCGFWRDKEAFLVKARYPLARLALKDWQTYKTA